MHPNHHVGNSRKLDRNISNLKDFIHDNVFACHNFRLEQENQIKMNECKNHNLQGHMVAIKDKPYFPIRLWRAAWFVNAFSQSLKSVNSLHLNPRLSPASPL